MSGLLVAAWGLILHRGHECFPQEGFGRVASARFGEYLGRWAHEGEDFLPYVVHAAGPHQPVETSRKGLLYERVDRMLSEFSARGQACDLRCLFPEPMIKEMASSHMASALVKQSQSTRAQASQHVAIQRDVDGHVLSVSVPHATWRCGDVAGLLRIMDSLVADVSILHKHWMRVRLVLQGYGVSDDPFTPQAGQFMNAVVKAAPWWMAIASPHDYGLWLSLPMAPEDDVGGDHDESHVFLVRLEIGGLEAGHLLSCSEMLPGKAMDDMCNLLRMESCAYFAHSRS